MIIGLPQIINIPSTPLIFLSLASSYITLPIISVTYFSSLSKCKTPKRRSRNIFLFYTVKLSSHNSQRSVFTIKSVRNRTRIKYSWAMVISSCDCISQKIRFNFSCIFMKWWKLKIFDIAKMFSIKNIIPDKDPAEFLPKIFSSSDVLPVQFKRRRE